MATPNLVTLTDSRSSAAEAYRALRTNLMFSSVEKPIQTLLVTSPSTADDKSITLANLAVTFAQAGNKTILVDTDLHQPSQHIIWNIPNDRGLSDMMIDDSVISSPPLIESGVDNLQILPSGNLPPNPADILGSKRMDEVIGVLKARATYIFFDAPPVLTVTDAALLGIKLDAVLLTVRSGTTRRDHTARARSTLEQVHVRVVGAVLTNAPKETMTRY